MRSGFRSVMAIANSVFDGAAQTRTGVALPRIVRDGRDLMDRAPQSPDPRDEVFPAPEHPNYRCRFQQAVAVPYE